MLIQTSLIGADEKFNLAVADLDAINVSMSDAVVVSEFIRSAFVNDRSFRVLERKNMDLILAEQAFQRSGCTTYECAVQMGKLLNVQKIIVGSLSKLFDNYVISINMIDVETSEIVASVKRTLRFRGAAS